MQTRCYKLILIIKINKINYNSAHNNFFFKLLLFYMCFEVLCTNSSTTVLPFYKFFFVLYNFLKEANLFLLGLLNSFVHKTVSKLCNNQTEWILTPVTQKVLETISEQHLDYEKILPFKGKQEEAGYAGKRNESSGLKSVLSKSVGCLLTCRVQ